MANQSKARYNGEPAAKPAVGAGGDEGPAIKRHKPDCDPLGIAMQSIK